jgi:hypothetical protein
MRRNAGRSPPRCSASPPERSKRRNAAPCAAAASSTSSTSAIRDLLWRWSSRNAAAASSPTIARPMHPFVVRRGSRPGCSRSSKVHTGPYWDTMLTAPRSFRRAPACAAIRSARAATSSMMAATCGMPMASRPATWCWSARTATSVPSSRPVRFSLFASIWPRLASQRGIRVCRNP